MRNRGFRRQLMATRSLLRRLAQGPIARGPPPSRRARGSERSGVAAPRPTHTALNHAVNDPPPHLCPESVHRQTEPRGDVASLDHDIVTMDLDERWGWVHRDALGALAASISCRE